MANEHKGLYIPRVVLDDVNLGASTKLVYAVMIEAMDEYSICSLSAQEIAERLSVTRATANNARRTLCQLGYAELIPGTWMNYRLIKIKRKRKEPNNE